MQRRHFIALAASGLLTESVAQAQAEKTIRKANFGSPAPGSLPHFFGEIISRDTQTNLVHVPFTGGAPLMHALLGNQVCVSRCAALKKPMDLSSWLGADPSDT